LNKKSSNTVQNRKAGTFTKGDPRINRNGRPKSFDAFRELALQIAGETVSDGMKKLGQEEPKPEVAKLPIAEFILRKWAFSNDSKLQKAFTEVAFGKVPDVIDIPEDSNLEEVILKIVNAKTN
jgi:hypothetical protein